MATTSTRKRKPSTRHTLTIVEFDRAHDHLCKEIARRSARWGSHGWAVVGSRRSLRIEISVPKTLLTPKHPVGTIPLPPSLGGSIKPAVRSSLDGLSLPLTANAPQLATAVESLAAAISEPFAPGSRILVDSRPVQRAGIACFVNADGSTYVLTCGHVFSPGAVGTGLFVAGSRVAVLEHNFLEDDPQLDAACCKLLPRGLQLLAASTTAPTWYREVLDPGHGQGDGAVFWPTNEAAGNAITTSINSCSSCESNLHNEFWDLSLCRMVRTEAITVPGDSGSLLAVDNCYYASCTGSPSWSYFTPLQVVIDRMRDRFTEVSLWQPS